MSDLDDKDFAAIAPYLERIIKLEAENSKYREALESLVIRARELECWALGDIAQEALK